jgi:hypothetical protein
MENNNEKAPEVSSDKKQKTEKDGEGKNEEKEKEKNNEEKDEEDEEEKEERRKKKEAEERFAEEVNKTLALKASIKEMEKELKEVLAEENTRRREIERIRKESEDTIDKRTRGQFRLIGFIMKKARRLTDAERILIAETEEMKRKERSIREKLDNLRKQTLEYKIRECELGSQSIDLAITIYNVVSGGVSASNVKGTLRGNSENAIDMNGAMSIDARSASKVSVGWSFNIAERAIMSVVSIVTTGIRGGMIGAGKDSKYGEVFNTRGKITGFLRGLASGLKFASMAIFNPKTFFRSNTEGSLRNKIRELDAKKREIEGHNSKIEEEIRRIRMIKEPEVVLAEDRQRQEVEEKEKREKKENFRAKTDKLAELKRELEDCEKKLDEQRGIQKEIGKKLYAKKSRNTSKEEEKQLRNDEKQLRKTVALTTKEYKKRQKEIKEREQDLKKATNADPFLLGGDTEENDEEARKRIEEANKNKEQKEFDEEVVKVIRFMNDIEDHQSELKRLRDQKLSGKGTLGEGQIDNKIKNELAMIEELKLDSLEYKIMECEIAKNSARAALEGFAQTKGIIDSVVTDINRVIGKIIIFPFIGKAIEMVMIIGSFVSGAMAGSIAGGVEGAKEKGKRIIGFFKGFIGGLRTAAKGLVAPDVVFGGQEGKLKKMIEEEVKLGGRYKKIIEEAKKRRMGNSGLRENIDQAGEQKNAEEQPDPSIAESGADSTKIAESTFVEQGESNKIVGMDSIEDLTGDQVRQITENDEMPENSEASKIVTIEEEGGEIMEKELENGSAVEGKTIDKQTEQSDENSKKPIDTHKSTRSATGMEVKEASGKESGDVQQEKRGEEKDIESEKKEKDLETKKKFDEEVDKIWRLKKEMRNEEMALRESLAKKEEKEKKIEEIRNRGENVVNKKTRGQFRLVKLLMGIIHGASNEEKILLGEKRKAEEEAKKSVEKLNKLKKQTLEYRIRECELGVQSIGTALTICNIVKNNVNVGGFEDKLKNHIKSAVNKNEDTMGTGPESPIASSISSSFGIAEKAIMSVASIVAAGVKGGIVGIREEGKYGETLNTSWKVTRFLRGMANGLKSASMAIFNPKTFFRNNIEGNLRNKIEEFNNKKNEINRHAIEIEKEIMKIRLLEEPDIVEAEERERKEKEDEEKRSKIKAFEKEKGELLELRKKEEEYGRELDEYFERKKKVKEALSGAKTDKTSKNGKGLKEIVVRMIKKRGEEEARGVLNDEVNKDAEKELENERRGLKKVIIQVTNKQREKTREIREKWQNLRKAMDDDPILLASELPALTVENNGETGKKLGEIEKDEEQREFDKDVARTIGLMKEIECHHEELKQLKKRKSDRRGMAGKRQIDKQIRDKQDIIDRLERSSMEYKTKECEIAKNSARAALEAYAQAGGIIGSVTDVVRGIVGINIVFSMIPFVNWAFGLAARAGGFISGLVAGSIAGGVVGAKEKGKQIGGFFRGLVRGFRAALKGLSHPALVLCGQAGYLGAMVGENKDLEEKYKKVLRAVRKKIRKDEQLGESVGQTGEQRGPEEKPEGGTIGEPVLAGQGKTGLDGIEALKTTMEKHKGENDTAIGDVNPDVVGENIGQGSEDSEAIEGPERPSTPKVTVMEIENKEVVEKESDYLAVENETLEKHKYWINNGPESVDKPGKVAVEIEAGEILEGESAGKSGKMKRRTSDRKESRKDREKNRKNIESSKEVGILGDLTKDNKMAPPIPDNRQTKSVTRLNKADSTVENKNRTISSGEEGNAIEQDTNEVGSKKEEHNSRTRASGDKWKAGEDLGHINRVAARGQHNVTKGNSNFKKVKHNKIREIVDKGRTRSSKDYVELVVESRQRRPQAESVKTR